MDFPIPVIEVAPENVCHTVSVVAELMEFAGMVERDDQSCCRLSDLLLDDEAGVSFERKDFMEALVLGIECFDRCDDASAELYAREGSWDEFVEESSDGCLIVRRNCEF